MNVKDTLGARNSSFTYIGSATEGYIDKTSEGYIDKTSFEIKKTEYIPELDGFEKESNKRYNNKQKKTKKKKKKLKKGSIIGIEKGKKIKIKIIPK